MAQSAYYSKNKSYSRSYNAECAEEDGRYPATRFKAVYGIDPRKVVAAHEWHHVGKYAARVDYFDIEDVMQALADMPYVDRRKLIGRGKFRDYWQTHRFEFLKIEREGQDIRPIRRPAFAAALISKCEGKGGALKAICRMLDDRGVKGSVFVRYGTHFEDDMRVTHYGEMYSVGSIKCASGGWIKPFNLDEKNFKHVIREISQRKAEWFDQMRGRWKLGKYSFSRENVLKIIRRKKDNIVHYNSLAGCTQQDWLIAAKIMKKLYNIDYSVDADGRVNVAIN